MSKKDRAKREGIQKRNQNQFIELKKRLEEIKPILRKLVN